MLVKPSISDQCIIDCLQTYYHIQVATLTFLSLGADVNAFVYKAEAQNKSSYFIKLKQGYPHDIGIAIVELLSKTEIQNIIPPVKTIQGYSSQRIVEDIAEYGQNLFLTVEGGENRSEMYQHFIAMFAPKGMVDIAFKTDDWHLK